MANPAFRPDSEGRTLKDNERIQAIISRSGPGPGCRTRNLGNPDSYPSWTLCTPGSPIPGH
eukprot:scaffold109076_cov66-Phaeocystis_antarctica.AAC.1